MTEDRQQLLVFGGDGDDRHRSRPARTPSPGACPASSPARSWRPACTSSPGSCSAAGSSPGSWPSSSLLDGMFFVQSRIGMNDVYVGAVHRRRVRRLRGGLDGLVARRAPAPWLAMPAIGVLLGLALATKWVAAYAIGALALLLLVRSALGRVVAILGLIGITSVLGYIAISVPEGEGLGNLTFLLIMVGLTLLAVGRGRGHSIRSPGPTTRQWFALIAPTALGGRRVLRRARDRPARHGLRARPGLGHAAPAGHRPVRRLARRVRRVHRRRTAGLRAAARRRPAPDDPRPLLPPPDPPPPDWLRPGWLAGLPVRLGARLPRGHPARRLRRLVHPVGAASTATSCGPASRPATTGQTLLELTGQMYGYHNGLTSPHPASSPWWAWPFDLKPVWFYQDCFAGGTTAAIYDAGNLVIWWLGDPGDGLRRGHGLPPPEPRAGPHHDRLRGAVDPLGAHRSGGLPVPLLHGPAVRHPRPRLLRRRAVARRRRAGPGWSRASPAALAIVGPAADVAAVPAAVLVRRRRVGQPGLAGLPGGHPRARRDRPHAWPCSSSSWSGVIVLGRAVLALGAEADDERRPSADRRPAAARAHPAGDRRRHRRSPSRRSCPTRRC